MSFSLDFVIFELYLENLVSSFTVKNNDAKNLRRFLKNRIVEGVISNQNTNALKCYVINIVY